MNGGDEQVEQVLADLEQLEQRAARVILRPPPPSRAERLAALMNWLVYGRWPGEVKRGDPVAPGQITGRSK